MVQGWTQDLMGRAHAMACEAVVEALDVSLEGGLSRSEVERRRGIWGKNEMPQLRARSAWRIFLAQFKSLIIALLGGAIIVALLYDDRVEAGAILVVLIVNASIGFITERQAERALDALRRATRSVVRVRREGREAIIDAEDLVPGDIVLLGAGDRVPADLRIISTANLWAEESALTGESAPVAKGASPVADEAPLAERHSMLYLGTIIVAGQGMGVVTATGAHTELGRIGRLVGQTAKESTPLERRLADLGRRLVMFVLAIAFIIFIAGWARGHPLPIMAEVAISLAVAAIPEGLPAVTTLILALGMLRMARERAIVRRLPAVETLGSVTVICTDKTGTLTENRMTAHSFYLSSGQIVEISHAQAAPADRLLERALLVCLLCNNASWHVDESGELRATGDPTEVALLEATRARGLPVERLRGRYRKVHEVPFDASTMYMITVHRADDDHWLVALKGAPAVILDLCSSRYDRQLVAHMLTPQEKECFLEANREMADRALRVLGLAEKIVAGASALEELDLTGGYTFIGFVGMIDPPRAGVTEAITRARLAGIRIIMLTGDQLNTACAIARELGIGTEHGLRALHARELRDVGWDRLAEIATATDVFARVSPEDKLRIVMALKAAREIVAVTGDGVNDAPALKAADVGIAMGMRGTEAAKEAADIILTDDNFATLVKAIEGGRTIYANITKFVHSMYSHNLSEVLAIFSAILGGLPLPLLPLQILWVNMITDVLPAFALAVEPPDPETMQRQPRPPRATLLSRRLLWLIVWQGAMLAAFIVGAYLWALIQYGPGAHARTIALLALVAVQLGHMFNCRSRVQSAFHRLGHNRMIILALIISLGLQLLAIHLSPLATVLDLTPLAAADYVAVGLCFTLPIVIVETTKFIARLKKDHHAS